MSVHNDKSNDATLHKVCKSVPKDFIWATHDLEPEELARYLKLTKQIVA